MHEEIWCWKNIFWQICGMTVGHVSPCRVCVFGGGGGWGGGGGAVAGGCKQTDPIDCLLFKYVLGLARNRCSIWWTQQSIFVQRNRFVNWILMVLFYSCCTQIVLRQTILHLTVVELTLISRRLPTSHPQLSMCFLPWTRHPRPGYHW